MPYASINELPAAIRQYSEKRQSQWLHVFNTVYKSTGGDEGRAMMAANSVLKNFTKSANNQNRHDSFSTLVDEWLGNLNG